MVSRTVEKAIYEKYQHCCAICGRETAFDEGEVDHIKPKTKGGTDEPSNLQWLCHRCNKLKGCKRTNDEVRELLNIEIGKVEEGIDSRVIVIGNHFNAEKANEFIDLLNNQRIKDIETQSKILENLRDLLPSMSKYDLKESERSKTNQIIDFIKKEIENENSLTICLDMLKRLSSIRDEEIKNRLKDYFLVDIERMYNGLTVEQKSDALRILQKLNEHNPEYMKKLILEAINDWNETDFEKLSSKIDIHEIKDDNISTIRRELYILRSEAEENGEKEKKERIDKFLTELR